MRPLLLWIVLLSCACGAKEAGTADSSTDADGDGATSTAAGGDDCDDDDPTVHPDADEICDGVDNDCDGQVDNGDDRETFHADDDGDGFGDPDDTITACEQPDGHLVDASDCDDQASDVHPDGVEVCDGADNDCDGEIDEGASDKALFYADADGDGFGDSDASVRACEPPSGYVADSTDCDVSDGSIHPGATELCDGFDWNCDGTEAAVASFEDSSGVWTDMTDALTGTSGRPAVVLLEAPGTLHVCEGTWYTNLTIGADTEIVGPYGADTTILSGGGNGKVVRIVTDDLTVGLSGLTLTRGEGDSGDVDRGGGLYCDAASVVTVQDAVFTDNHASAGAGAAFFGGCEADINDTSFKKGEADNGGGLFIEDATVTLNRVDFISNEAFTDAGAIKLTGNSALSMTDGTISNSTARRGGAVFNSGGSATFDSVTFESSTGDLMGGAVCSLSGEDTFIDVTFTDGFINYDGGAYFGYESTLTVSGGSFEGNAASDGGAIALLYGVATIDGTSFTDNEATGTGGGIYLSDSSVTGTSVSFTGNSPDDLEANGSVTMGKKADFECSSDDGC